MNRYKRSWGRGRWLAVLAVLIFRASAATVFAQTSVRSLAELRSAVLLSNQHIIMEPGSYNFEEGLPSGSRDITCSGSNNIIDLTDVYVEVPVGCVSTKYLLIPGTNNTWMGGEFEDTYPNGSTNITDFSAYNQDRVNYANGLGGAAVFVIEGDGNLVNGLKLTVRGSYPYGYGSIYGIGSDNVFGLDKRCGLRIAGNDNTLDGVEIQQRAFGHGIYMQNGATGTVIKNSLVEGRVRPMAELYAETNSYDLPFRSDYTLPLSEDLEPIPTNQVMSLSEDGYRMYSGTGRVTVENCTAKKMRGGIRLYLGSSAVVSNSVAIDCASCNYNLPTGGTVVDSSGNFAYAPLSDFRLSRNNMNIEWTIIPSPHAIGSHNLCDVLGSGHTILFHRTAGPEDTDLRSIVVSGDNSTIINQTEYPIVLESTADNNTIISYGSVTDNGSGNSVRLSSFSPDPDKTYYIDCPAHNLRLAATGESEDPYTTSTTTIGEDVEWRFIDKGNGYWHIDRAAGGAKPRLRTDNSSDADMQETTSSGEYTYFEIAEGIESGTHYLTLPDGPSSYKRLQIDSAGRVQMRPVSDTGDWVSFTITEAPGTLSGIERWRVENFGGSFDFGDGADDADPDHDSHDNLMEYGSGSDPNDSGSEPLLVVGATQDDQHLTLSFNRIADSNLTYSVDTTTALNTNTAWTTIWSSTGPSNTVGAVTVEDAGLMSEQTNRFMRLKLSY